MNVLMIEFEIVVNWAVSLFKTDFAVVIIFIAIVLMIFIEIKRQHPKHIGLGVLVLALICALGYVFREILFTGVAVI